MKREGFNRKVHMQTLKSIERLGIVCISGCPILFVAIFLIAAWPNWWEPVVYERSPMTWLQSVLLLLCSISAFLCAGLCKLEGNTRKTLLWSGIGLFFLFLTLDERFMFHENLRDTFFAPRGIRMPPFYWTSPGDFVPLLYAVLGLAGLPLVFHLFKERRSCLILLLTAVLLGLVIIVTDSINTAHMSRQARTIEQFVEEIVETASMVMFLNAFFLMSACYLGQLIDAGKAASPAR